MATTLADIQKVEAQIANFQKLMGNLQPSSASYKSYSAMVQNLQVALAKMQADYQASQAPAPMATPTPTPADLTGLTQVTNRNITPAPRATVAPKGDQWEQITPAPTATVTPNNPVTSGNQWTQMSEADYQSQQKAIADYEAAGGHIPPVNNRYQYVLEHPLAANTPAADTNTGNTSGATGGGDTTVDTNVITFVPFVGWGYWYYDAYGERQFKLLTEAPYATEEAANAATTAAPNQDQGETASEAAVNTAQAAYYNALANGQTEDAAQSAAQLAFDQQKWQEQLAWERENAASTQAAQQQQWQQQLAWYQQQAQMEAEQEAARLASERQSYLADLAANPRQWIKYNLETTNDAGTVPSWLSKLYEGKVEAGQSLNAAKDQGYMPILSKNWYNWLNPSERDMLSGYLSWAGTNPDDYWSNLWYMRGYQPKGAPKLVPVSQK